MAINMDKVKQDDSNQNSGNIVVNDNNAAKLESITQESNSWFAENFRLCRWYENYLVLFLSLFIFLPIGVVLLYINKRMNKYSKYVFYILGVFAISVFYASTNGQNVLPIALSLIAPIWLYEIFKVKGRYKKYSLFFAMVLLVPPLTTSTLQETVNFYLGLLLITLIPVIVFEVFKNNALTFSKRLGIGALCIIMILVANINLAGSFKYHELEQALDNDETLMVEEEYTINGEEFSDVFDTAYECWGDGDIENIGRVLVNDTVMDDAIFKNFFLKDYNAEKMIAICSSDLEFTKNSDKSVKYLMGFEYTAKYNDEKNIWMIGGYKTYTKN
jgi:hypothetical protein